MLEQRFVCVMCVKCNVIRCCWSAFFQLWSKRGWSTPRHNAGEEWGRRVAQRFYRCCQCNTLQSWEAFPQRESTTSRTAGTATDSRSRSHPAQEWYEPRVPQPETLHALSMGLHFDVSLRMCTFLAPVPSGAPRYIACGGCWGC